MPSTSPDLDPAESATDAVSPDVPTRAPGPTDQPRRLDDKARREAIKVGLTALRARGRRATTALPGGFRLLDRDGNCVAGDDYDLSAEDVIKFCNRIP
jgi:hypothetical protein